MINQIEGDQETISCENSKSISKSLHELNKQDFNSSVDSTSYEDISFKLIDDLCQKMLKYGNQDEEQLDNLQTDCCSQEDRSVSLINSKEHVEDSSHNFEEDNMQELLERNKQQSGLNRINSNEKENQEDQKEEIKFKKQLSLIERRKQNREIENTSAVNDIQDDQKVQKEETVVIQECEQNEAVLKKEQQKIEQNDFSSLKPVRQQKYLRSKKVEKMIEDEDKNVLTLIQFDSLIYKIKQYYNTKQKNKNVRLDRYGNKIVKIDKSKSQLEFQIEIESKDNDDTNKRLNEITKKDRKLHTVTFMDQVKMKKNGDTLPLHTTHYVEKHVKVKLLDWSKNESSESSDDENSSSSSDTNELEQINQ